MMRALPLLALLGAAPAPADITAAATCTLPRAETEAAFRALPLLATEDDTEADERGTVYTFREAILFGAPARGIKFSDYADSKAGTAMQTFEAIGSGDYGDVRTILLERKGRCDQESGQSCTLNLGNEGEWRKSLTFTQVETGRVAFACIFTKAG